MYTSDDADDQFDGTSIVSANTFFRNWTPPEIHEAARIHRTPQLDFRWPHTHRRQLCVCEERRRAERHWTAAQGSAKSSHCDTSTNWTGRRLNVIVQDTAVRGELKRLVDATFCGDRSSVVEGT